MAPNSAFDPQTDQPYKPGPSALENSMYDRLRAPRPPNERGWVSDPIGVVMSGPFKGLIAVEVQSELAAWLESCLQSALDREPAQHQYESPVDVYEHLGAVDATFENETRPHR